MAAIETTFVMFQSSSMLSSSKHLEPPMLIRLPSYHPSRWRRQKQKQAAVHCSATIPATPPLPVPEEEPNVIRLELNEINRNCKSWTWRGYKINYLMYNGDNDNRTPPPSLPAVLLVHGFGASIAHWRNNIATLAQTGCPVYAVDLLGFGNSDKPIGFPYTMEAWSELILDFINDIIQKPTVLVGNSVGSLACVIAATTNTAPSPLICGLVLLNCAGGMNNKAIVDDWRIKLVLPLLWLIDFLLKQKPIANFIFNKAKDGENIRNVLRSVYGNQDAVDDELVEIIREPANDDGALDAFVSIVTGPPGPNPVKLIPVVKEKNMPVLVLWGDEDPFTPLDGPVGKYFTAVAGESEKVELFVLNRVGHCPHDDRPELVHERLLPWLAALSTNATPPNAIIN